MRLWVELEASTGERKTLGLGGMIGRGPNADLQVADPRVSVAHAGVALRNGHLCLLRYRGTLWVGGTEAGDPLPLHEGLVVELGTGLWLEVVDLRLPVLVPTLQIDDARPLLLDAESWHIDDRGRAMPGPSPGRPVLWNDGQGTWYVQHHGANVELTEDEWVAVDGHRLRFRRLHRADVGDLGTRKEVVPPIAICSWHEETLIQVEGAAPIALHGIAHRMVRELGRLTGTDEIRTVHWRELAHRVWPGNQDHQKRWEREKVALAHRLRSHGLPPDLFRSHRGLVRLVLRDGDRFELRDPHL